MSKQVRILEKPVKCIKESICTLCGSPILVKELYKYDQKYRKYHVPCADSIATLTPSETVKPVEELKEEPKKIEETLTPVEPIFDCTGIKEGDKVIFNEDGTQTIK